MATNMHMVVTLLVVWALIVTVWMMVLSINGSWNHCTKGRENVVHQPHNLYELPLAQTLAHVPSEATTTEASTTEASSDSVRKQRLAHYFSRIMHRPDSEGVISSDSASLALEENCTGVILTYKLARTMSKVISHYCKVSFLQTIFVVWNNVNETIPFTLKMWETKCTSSEVKFVRPAANKLINRYLLWEEIKTNCVCFLDDDLIVSVYDMIFGYEVWQNFRYQLVGFQESSIIQNSNGSYVYKPYQQQRYVGIKYKTAHSKIEMKNGNRILVIGNKTYVLGKPIESRRKAVPEKPDGYSIMGGPSFVHKAYLEMYFDPTIVPVSAVEYVEKLNNCEDILLSIVVTKFLQDTDTSNVTHTGVLTMKTSLTIKHLQEESRREEVPLSKRPSYYPERSECLNRFSQLYGYLPLQSSNTIATLV